MRQLLLVRLLFPLLFLAALSPSFCALPVYAGPADSIDTRQLADEVRAEFLHAWNAYKKHAWGHDGLRPLSMTGYDWHGDTPLFVSALDALDTMILMGLKEEADSTREFIARNLSFDKDIYVKNFEITIRFLGGLISCYQLSGDRRLLDLADDLGRRLLPVFRSPTGMPYVHVNLKTGQVRDSISNPAEIGTLLVEWGALSMLTGKPEYYNVAKNALLRLYELRSPVGLVGTSININTGEWVNKESHIGAAIDSYYEYLLKGALLFPEETDCKIMWDESMAALVRHLMVDSTERIWWRRVDMETGRQTRPLTGALDAFFPAVLVLAGDLDRARRSQEAFYYTWTKFGIEPSTYDFETGKAPSPQYYLNPEIFESAYYLHRVTGDPRYLRMGRQMFEDLKRYCRTGGGYAELKSVITKEKSDRMETYFFAETLKYLYLLFAPPETLDFEKVIFNTEAHPIRRTW